MKPGKGSVMDDQAVWRWKATRLALIFCSAVAAGCAGSPVQVANAPGARLIQVGGEGVYVVQQQGLWHATYRDYMSKQLYVGQANILPRKLGLVRAVELASGCKVADSTIDPMAITLQAVVACK